MKRAASVGPLPSRTVLAGVHWRHISLLKVRPSWSESTMAIWSSWIMYRAKLEGQANQAGSDTQNYCGVLSRQAMKILAITVTLTLSPITPSFAAQLSTHNLLDRWQEANGYCRGGSGEETMLWCNVRDGLDEILSTRGWCYAKIGQAGYQMRWHLCGPDSNQPEPVNAEQHE